MSVEIREGAIALSIESDRFLKWDDHPAFIEGVRRLGDTKAVDVCVNVEGEGAVFIEMKDFRAAAIENSVRVTSDKLAHEVASKVRDTLAGLVWACARGLSEPFHESLTRAFLERPKALVVLWLETDRPDIGGASALQDSIRSLLKPHIVAKVIVTSTLLEQQSSSPLRWLRARGLPSQRIATRKR